MSVVKKSTKLAVPGKFTWGILGILLLPVGICLCDLYNGWQTHLIPLCQMCLALSPTQIPILKTIRQKKTQWMRIIQLRSSPSRMVRQVSKYRDHQVTEIVCLLFFFLPLSCASISIILDRSLNDWCRRKQEKCKALTSANGLEISHTQAVWLVFRHNRLFVSCFCLILFLIFV